MTKEELEKKIDALEAEVDAIWEESLHKENGCVWYSHHPILKELIELHREYRLIQDYELYDLDDFGHHMTMEEFIDGCKEGCFTDYDGEGVYATATQQSNIDLSPEDIISGKYRNDFSHVVWYNK